jgi:hypothetical protein
VTPFGRSQIYCPVPLPPEAVNVTDPPTVVVEAEEVALTAACADSDGITREGNGG